MLIDDKPIMDGRWGDEHAFQEHKEFDHATSRETRPSMKHRITVAREFKDRDDES